MGQSEATDPQELANVTMERNMLRARIRDVIDTYDHARRHADVKAAWHEIAEAINDLRLVID